MSIQQNFVWPANQDIVLGVQVTPPTNISSWTIEFDLMYRQTSPQPIYSAFNLSGTITVVNPATGIFQVPLSHTLISGVMNHTNVLTYTTRRIDSGSATDINGGAIVLTPY